MASILQAVRVFGPKLVYNRTATSDELAAWLAGRTGLTRGQVRLVLSELQEAILSFAMSGTPVNLEGIGRLRPTISRGGVLRLRWLPDRRLALAMANLAAYAGTVANRGSVRMDDAAYKAVWDAAYPEDPLVTRDGRDGGAATSGAGPAALGEPAAVPGDPQAGIGGDPDRSDA